MVDKNQIKNFYSSCSYFFKKYILLFLVCFISISAISIYKYYSAENPTSTQLSIFTNSIEPLILEDIMAPIVSSSFTSKYTTISSLIDIPIDKASEICAITYTYNTDRYRDQYLPFATIKIETNNPKYVDTVYSKIITKINQSPYISNFYKKESESLQSLISNYNKDILKINETIDQGKNVIDLGNLYLSLYTIQKEKSKTEELLTSLTQGITKSTDIVYIQNKKSKSIFSIITFISSIALTLMLILLIEFIQIGRSKS